MSKGTIIILDGMLKGGEFEVDKRLTIGRNRDNHIQIPYMRTSRFHAEVVPKDGGYWLRDLNSTSGTFVNGELVLDKSLNHGDEIVIGNCKLQFLLSDQARPQPQSATVTRISFDNATADTATTTAEMGLAQPDQLLRAYSGENTQEELKKLILRYSALYQANHLISSEAPPASTYNEILKQILAVVPADRGIVMVKDPNTEELVVMASRARKEGVDLSHVSVSRTIINKSMEQRVAVMTSDALQDYQFASQSSIIAQNIRSVICSPLLYGNDEVLGLIYLDTQSIVETFDQDMLKLVTAIAGPAAIAIKNSKYIDDLKQKSEELQQSYLNTITVITNSIEARDKYTIGHAWRVTRFSMAIATELGWDEEQKENLEMGGVLHDVGKVGIKDAILSKAGRLTDEEFGIMRLHPEIGSRILKDVPFLKPALPYVRCHHERWDGRGYPDGMSELHIPIEGRLLAIADAFDAMASDRVYRKGMSPEVAIAEIEKGRGTQFDPKLASLFIEIYRSGKIDYVLQNQAREMRLYVLCPSCSTYLGLKEESASGDHLKCPICRKEIVLSKEQGDLTATLA